MTALQRASRPSVSDASTGLSQKSRSNVLDLGRIDGLEFRVWFAPALARFLRANFATPEQVAQAFGVRNTTAWNWWNGDNRASGDVVARVFLSSGHAQAWFMSEWEGR